MLGIHGGPFPPLDEDAAVCDAAPWISAGFAYVAVEYGTSGALGPRRSAFALNGEDVPGEGADVGDIRAALTALRATPDAARIDLDRIVVYGFSYGAYVLGRWLTSGAVPNGTRLAVVHEGIADLRTMDHASLRTQSERRGRKPDEDPEHWAAASPIEYAGRVTVPTLLAYGTKSPALGQGLAWKRALEAREIEHHWLGIADEGHVFSSAAMHQLARHVAGLLETDTDTYASASQ